MSQHPEPDRPTPASSPAPSEDVKPGFVERRRERLRAEVQRNRQGGHTVPTWVMALALVVMVGAWLYFVLSS
jgi:type VI protein secretion system component VasF